MSTLHERLLRWFDVGAPDGDLEDAIAREEAALRAVVELHGWSHARGSTYLQCDGCPSTSDATMTAWPCPTITAIADALGVETGETP